jgi:hypothetical protein
MDYLNIKIEEMDGVVELSRGVYWVGANRKLAGNFTCFQKINAFSKYK